MLMCLSCAMIVCFGCSQRATASSPILRLWSVEVSDGGVEKKKEKKYARM